MKRHQFAAALLLALTGCAQPGSQIATVDIARIQANWPKFINYHNQLASDAEAIQRSSGSPRQKQQELAALNSRMISMQNEITGDLTGAAQQVANSRHFNLIVTRQYVGYGGVDITSDIEKILKITEAASPTP